jgi:putative NADH-flavin reductase
MAGQEVVVSTLGVRRITRNTVLSDGTRNILNSMREYKVRRFICETSVGVGDSRGQMGWIFDHLILTTFLKAVFADKEVQEQYIKSSDTDWIILRPAMLTNGPRTGVYQCWSGAKPAKAKMKISRADVADFAVTNFSEANYLRQAISLSY